MKKFSSSYNIEKTNILENRMRNVYVYGTKKEKGPLLISKPFWNIFDAIRCDRHNILH